MLKQWQHIALIENSTHNTMGTKRYCYCLPKKLELSRCNKRAGTVSILNVHFRRTYTSERKNCRIASGSRMKKNGSIILSRSLLLAIALKRSFVHNVKATLALILFVKSCSFNNKNKKKELIETFALQKIFNHCNSLAARTSAVTFLRPLPLYYRAFVFEIHFNTLLLIL